MNSQRRVKQLDWTEEISRKFKLLKEKFQEFPIRSYPRYDIEEEFKLTTDFSGLNLSAILSQVQDGKKGF